MQLTGNDTISGPSESLNCGRTRKVRRVHVARWRSAKNCGERQNRYERVAEHLIRVTSGAKWECAGGGVIAATVRAGAQCTLAVRNLRSRQTLPLIRSRASQRVTLYLRQTFTTPGIYVKTMFFSVGDQINNSPPEWGEDFSSHIRRVGSRHAQFVLQNSCVAWGNEMLLRSSPVLGILACTRRAVARNIVTYDRSERRLRPQIPFCAGAFTAGAVAGTWKPKDRDLVTEG